MENDRYFQNEEKRSLDYFIMYTRLKDKHVSYIDSIPKQYKRKSYIIDKLNCKKKNVE